MHIFTVLWKLTLITMFMGPTWGPSGADRTQVDPMSAPWILLSGKVAIKHVFTELCFIISIDLNWEWNYLKQKSCQCFNLAPIHTNFSILHLLKSRAVSWVLVLIVSYRCPSAFEVTSWDQGNIYQRQTENNRAQTVCILLGCTLSY